MKLEPSPSVSVAETRKRRQPVRKLALAISTRWPRLLLVGFLLGSCVRWPGEIVFGSVIYSVILPSLGLAGFACLYLLWVFTGRRKLLVLYLRRFRRGEASALMVDNIERSLSKRFRIVTLDDATFPPLEVPRWERFVSRAGAPAAGCAVGLVALAVLFWAVFQVAAPMISNLGGIIGLAVMFGLAQSIPLWILAAFHIMVISVAAAVHRGRVRRRARFAINTEDDLLACLRRMRELSGWFRGPSIMGPQATVVRTNPDLWRTTVTQLVRYTATVIVDVSEPSENLLWELDLLRRDESLRFVAIGQADRVSGWNGADNGAVVVDGEVRQKPPIQASEVLLYRPGAGWMERRRFRRRLRAHLTRVAQPARIAELRRRRDLALRPRERAALVWSALKLYGGIFLLGGFVVPVVLVLLMLS